MNSLILTLLVFSPLAGAAVLLFIPKEKERALKTAGLVATMPALILSGIILIQNALGADIERFSVSVPWFKMGNVNLGGEYFFTVNYELGMDGFSLIMMTLAAVLATLSASASSFIQSGWKGYFSLLLILETGMLGVFAAENLILFFIFLELTLVPMFFLIGKWGFAGREKAAWYYLLYNGIGSAILLIVIVYLFGLTGTVNIEKLMDLAGDFPAAVQLGLLLALLVSFGVKLPIVPLHTWMLHVHVQAPPPVVMLHSGVLLKIGAYGTIRIGIGLFPEAFQTLGTAIMILGTVNLLYGAFLALIQTDFKRILAYSSVSHMGIVLIGLGAMNEAGIQGAIFQTVSHGFISALLFLLVGVMAVRFQTTDIRELGGLARKLPKLSSVLLAAGMASLGLPGMSGFISEFMAFMGIFLVQPELGAVAAVGLILTAAYVLRAVLSITFGKEKGAEGSLPDLKWHEAGPAWVLLFLIISVGVFPNGLAVPLQPAIETIMKGIGG
ncbi:NADH-quinone oxidoreductase subunit M [Metabacillus sp. FJAT-52054]|uniref:NADH-quinone oxidoreductase subunit M n=1 Tax=Metabacillus sediminis TaxID=3117746 RepID=A0ABZ2NGQ8_9BACI